MRVQSFPPLSGGRLLVLLAFGNFIIGMGAFVVIGIITPISEGLGIDRAEAGIVLTAYAFAYALASPLAVILTRNVDRRVLLTGAMAVFALGSIASALASNIGLLAASRIVVALGGAVFTPGVAGVAVALSTPENRGKSLAAVFGGITMAQVAGVPGGAWIAYHFGWAATFWIVAGLAVAGTLVLYAAIPSRIQFQGSSIAAILGTLKNLRTSFAILFTATLIAAVYIPFTYLGPIIESNLGRDPELRTFFLVLYGSGAVFGNAVGGYLTDRIGSFRTLALISIAQTIIMPFFSLSPWAAFPFAILIGLWSAFGWSFMAPQQTRLVAFAPQAQALVIALNAAMIYVGIAIGSAISAFILTHGGLGQLGIAGGIGGGIALLHLLISEWWSRRTNLTAQVVPTESA